MGIETEIRKWSQRREKKNSRNIAGTVTMILPAVATVAKLC
jgi:hypothetical protein